MSDPSKDDLDFDLSSLNLEDDVPPSAPAAKTASSDPFNFAPVAPKAGSGMPCAPATSCVLSSATTAAMV